MLSFSNRDLEGQVLSHLDGHWQPTRQLIKRVEHVEKRFGGTGGFGGRIAWLLIIPKIGW